MPMDTDLDASRRRRLKYLENTLEYLENRKLQAENTMTVMRNTYPLGHPMHEQTQAMAADAVTIIDALLTAVECEWSALAPDGYVSES
jgi:hypothetical protein